MKKYLIVLSFTLSNLGFSQFVAWNSKVESSYQNEVKSLIVNDEVYVAGTFRDEAKIFGIQVSGTINAQDDAYIASLDDQGNTKWVNYLLGTSSSSKINTKTIISDENDNLYICGEFVGSIDLGSNQSISEPNGKNAFYIAKYDKNGVFKWVTTQVGTSTALEYKCKSITYADGKIFAVGEVKGGAGTFGGFVINNPGTKEAAFVAQIDTNSTINNAYTVFTVTNESANLEGISFYKNHLYIVGQMKKNSGLIGNGTTISLTNTTGTEQLMLAKIDLQGNALWAKTATATTKCNGKFIKISKSGYILVAGEFEGSSLTFDESNSVTGKPTKWFFLVSYLEDGSLSKLIVPQSNQLAGEGKFQALAFDREENLWVGGELKGDMTIGSTGDAGLTVKKAFVAKFNETLGEEWIKVFDTQAESKVTGISFTKNGEILGGMYSGDLTLSSNNIITTGNQLAVKNSWLAHTDLEDKWLGTYTNEIGNKEYVLFPNPCKDFIQLSGDYTTSASSVNVQSIFSGAMQRVEMIDGIIDLSFLENGVYVLSVDGINHKIIKQ
jgi:hypothetical protein